MTLKNIKTSSRTFNPKVKPKSKAQNYYKIKNLESLNIKKVRDKAVPILKRQGITKAAVFGSCARGDNRKSSDIDFLIKAPKGMSLLDLSRLKLDLEDVFKRRVDVLTYGGIHPLLKDIILNSQKIIYEQKSQKRR